MRTSSAPSALISSEYLHYDNRMKHNSSAITPKAAMDRIEFYPIIVHQDTIELQNEIQVKEGIECFFSYRTR